MPLQLLAQTTLYSSFGFRMGGLNQKLRWVFPISCPRDKETTFFRENFSSIQSPNLLSERHFTTHTRTITTQKVDKNAEASRLSLINTKKKTFWLLFPPPYANNACKSAYLCLQDRLRIKSSSCRFRLWILASSVGDASRVGITTRQASIFIKP